MRRKMQGKMGLSKVVRREDDARRVNLLLFRVTPGFTASHANEYSGLGSEKDLSKALSRKMRWVNSITIR